MPGPLRQPGGSSLVAECSKAKTTE